MPTNLEMIQEAVKRGLPLPPDKEAIYNEAVKRGLVEDERISTTKDVGLSALSAVPKAASGILGMGRDAGDMLGYGLSYGMQRLFGVSPEEASSNNQRLRDVRAKVAETGLAPQGPKASEIRSGIETVTGPLHEPKTLPGKFADTATQMTVGSMALGAGGPFARLLQGVIPGVSTEAVAQIPGIKGTKLEPWARGITAFLASAGTQAATAPNSAEKVVSDAMQGVTKADMNKAMLLMENSRKPGGVALTWPEAIQHVTNGRTTLDEVSRFVENSRFGGPKMRSFYADRPQQVSTAVERQGNAIDPFPSRPEFIAPNVQKTAQEQIDRVNAGINNATRPLYNAANPVRLSPAEMQAIRANPAYDAIVKQIRADKYAGSHYQNVADDSVEMIDAVQKVMRGDAEGLKQSTQGIDRFASSIASDQRGRMVDAAKTASTDYETALAEQQRLRSLYLNPLQNGPVGKLAGTDAIEQQLGAIFPRNPVAGSEAGVAKAVSALAKKDPTLAANVIGAHIDNVFNEATKKLMSGPNSAGGAKFAVLIAGNNQQARNLEAAIRALPNGDSKWIGFKNLLENLEATGRRKAVGSPTDLNTAIRQDLKAGGAVGTAAANAASPARWTTIISDAYRDFRLGKNTQILAHLFTDPSKGKFLTELAMYKTGSPEALAITARALASAQGASNAVNNRDR